MPADPLQDPAESIRRLYAYVAYRVGPGPDAEDIVSDTVERAIRYRSSYDARRGSPAAWLVGIATRAVADHLRLRMRTDLYGLEPPEGYTEELTARADLRLDLVRGLASLDDRGRELVALRYGADLSSKEIGRILELTPGAVDVALHRTLARLRGIVEDPASAPEGAHPAEAS